MRHVVLAVLAAAISLALPGCANTGAGAPFIERAQVMEVARRVSADYGAAWNANDMSRFGALYAPEARHVTLAGEFLRGRQAIVAAHRANRTRYSDNVRMVTRLEGARAITDDAIVAVMIVEYVNDPNAPDGIQAARLTCTLARQHGQWLIAQAHASSAS